MTRSLGLLGLVFALAGAAHADGLPWAGRWRVAGRDPQGGEYAGRVELTVTPTGEVDARGVRVRPDGATEPFRAQGRVVSEERLELHAGSPGLIDALGGLAALEDAIELRSISPRGGPPRLTGRWSRSDRRERWVRETGRAQARVIAHRGAPFAAVENTLPAYAAAVRRGADGLELDVCLTADGQVVVWHDRDPDGTVAVLRRAGVESLPHVPVVPPPGDPFRRPVERLTLAELRAHYGYAPRRALGTGLLRLVGRGEPGPDPRERLEVEIPSFAEALRWAALAAPELEAIYVDTKTPSDPELARAMGAALAAVCRDDPLLREAGIASRLVVLNTERELLLALRDGFQSGGQAGGAPRWTRDLEGLDAEVDGLAEARAVDADRISLGWMPPHELLLTSEPFQARLACARSSAAAAGVELEIVVWTLDDPAEWELVLSGGPASIITNRPGRLRSWLQARGR